MYHIGSHEVWIDNIPSALEVPKYLQVKQVITTLLEATNYPLKGRPVDETAVIPRQIKNVKHKWLILQKKKIFKTKMIHLENQKQK